MLITKSSNKRMKGKTIHFHGDVVVPMEWATNFIERNGIVGRTEYTFTFNLNPPNPNCAPRDLITYEKAGQVFKTANSGSCIYGYEIV